MFLLYVFRIDFSVGFCNGNEGSFDMKKIELEY
jgi:hypothetical protein